MLPTLPLLLRNVWSKQRELRNLSTLQVWSDCQANTTAGSLINQRPAVTSVTVVKRGYLHQTWYRSPCIPEKDQNTWKSSDISTTLNFSSGKLKREQDKTVYRVERLCFTFNGKSFFSTSYARFGQLSCSSFTTKSIKSCKSRGLLLHCYKS